MVVLVELGAEQLPTDSVRNPVALRLGQRAVLAKPHFAIWQGERSISEQLSCEFL